MSKINVDTWEPESGTALTMGASGDTTTVPSGASLVVASGATINITGATQTGFPSAGFVNMEVYTASGTWTKTDNDPTKLVVEVQGAGGGGGGGSTSKGDGGGGGEPTPDPNDPNNPYGNLTFDVYGRPIKKYDYTGGPEQLYLRGGWKRDGQYIGSPWGFKSGGIANFKPYGY